MNGAVPTGMPVPQQAAQPTQSAGLNPQMLAQLMRGPLGTFMAGVGLRDFSSHLEKLMKTMGGGTQHPGQQQPGGPQGAAGAPGQGQPPPMPMPVPPQPGGGAPPPPGAMPGQQPGQPNLQMLMQLLRARQAAMGGGM